MAQPSELPSPPFIAVPGLPNFRDAGGYEVISDAAAQSSADGKPRTKIVRRGVLYRSSEPSKLTQEGAAQLTGQLGVRLIYDLRTPVEIARGYDGGEGWAVREVEGAERKFVPVFKDEAYSPEAMALHLKNYASESDTVSRISYSVPETFNRVVQTHLSLCWMRTYWATPFFASLRSNSSEAA